jgi:hypothetical protein
MKFLKPSLLFLPPVLALAIAGIGLGIQRQSISGMEQEIAILQKAIAVRAEAERGDSSGAMASASSREAKETQPLDWKKIADQLAETLKSSGTSDMRTTIRLQQRLQAMTQQELVAALDEIAALDLLKESHGMLEQMLIGSLSGKDPELVLTKFIARLQESDGTFIWHFSYAMQEFAKKDPAKATAWLDQQISAGTLDSKSLDGKSQSRLQFEGSLLSVLMVSDPDAAGLRLGGMPGDQRREIISQFQFHQLKEDDQPAFAKLVRDQLPEEDQGSALGRLASQVASRDGYSKVTEFLERIQASPAERTACVELAAESKIQSISYQNKVTREDFDAMREWVTTQSPGSTASVTGKALGDAVDSNRKMNFAEASTLAVEYNKASGNDELLTRFLESSAAQQNKEQARVLAASISDEKHRAEILKRLE